MSTGVRRCLMGLLGDRSGIAATEFAVIVPLMLVMFLGTVEFSTGLAIDRKVTLIARTLSDLASQSSTPVAAQVSSPITDSDLTNIFTASIAILTPYPPSPTKMTLSEVYVDSNNVAKIKWSKAAVVGGGATQATLAASNHNTDDIVTLPPALLVKKTYIIFSEVSYQYIPSIGYVMGKSGINLSDVSYTRPRQVLCVTYNNLPTSDCPTL
jgi:Flp pilus assembly protein TadG